MVLTRDRSLWLSSDFLFFSSQVGVAVFTNIVASISAIVAIVLYAVRLGRVNMSWRCDTVTTNYNCHYLAARAQVSLLLRSDAEFLRYFSECGLKCTFKGKWKRLLQMKLSSQFHVRIGPFSD